jgi:hypothetical protein
MHKDLLAYNQRNTDVTFGSIWSRFAAAGAQEALEDDGAMF